MSRGRPAPLLEVRGLVKRYREGEGERTVLDGLELELAAGEFMVLLGRSGSGKSTLLNLISGIDRADAGTVRLDGADLGQLSERGRTLLRRDRIGFVYQFFNLIPILTVWENVLLPMEFAGRAPAAAVERARGILERVGLAARTDTYPDRLSGGVQQRVALARALVHEPRLLLADEPTGNLDAASGAQVLQLLRELSRGRHAVLMVTHSEEAARVADRALVLEAGRLRPLQAGEP